MSDLPSYNVLDGNTSTLTAPRLPTVADFGGASYVNDIEFPPKPPEQIPAEGINLLINSIVGVCRTMPKASFTVARNGSSAALLGFSSCNTALVDSDITVEVADPLSAGENVLVIKWLKGQLPVAVNAPSGNLVAKLRNGADPVFASFVGATHAGVTVSVQTSAGSASTAFTALVNCDGEGQFSA